MHIDLKKTLAAIESCLSSKGEPGLNQLHRMYDLTLRLMSQEFAEFMTERHLTDRRDNDRSQRSRALE